MQMPSTRMTATNTLNKGLVMDFNPAVTQDDILTNALNATLLTFNGNEMSLQQDMGNGRVETAYLPEGYIPVGTCEFGDIIYIVSYNPLENKSQIGCFPSPERNITSDEISDLQQSLAASDFQDGGSNPTGKIKTTSVKKIVYGNKNMNPGDKYVIYEESTVGALDKNKEKLSDYGNTSHQINTWPKLLRLKVVSIEDSGKIIDLGASVKWYDKDYYLASLNSNATTKKPDLDSYRSLVSSAYSVFQSKVSGKLAILAELETIDGFSCTYDVFSSYDESSGKTTYKIYFYTAWETSHNDVNPSGFIITESEWVDREGAMGKGGQLVVPSLKDKTVVYAPDTTEIAPPIEPGVKGDGYDVTKVIDYTRLYKLEEPSATFSQYINNESYNAKLDGLISWDATKVQGYNSTLPNLRPITKVTRILNPETGEPLGDNDNYSYVYNLDSYTLDKSGNLTYYTKNLKGLLQELKPIKLTDDLVNNYFGKDIPKLVTDSFELQQTTVISVDGEDQVFDNDLSNMIWQYKVAPAMPYGVLDYLEVPGVIDFSKLGKGDIDLTTWRYYVSGNVATLSWGLEAYPEPNKGIAEVCLDFYDNQGFAAGYRISGKTSYSGTFTESIVLGQKNSSYKMSNQDAYGNSYVHAGTVAENPKEGTVTLNGANKATEVTGPERNESTVYYKDDAGTLYPNLLYLVRITVKYCPKDILGEYNTEATGEFKTFYRWFWTNGVFNESYYSINDFVDLRPQLGIDFSATFSTKGDKGTNQMQAKTAIYQNSSVPEYDKVKDDLYQTLAANVYSINQDHADDEKGNIALTLDPGLSEGFNTYNLNEAKINEINNILVKLGRSSITKSIDVPAVIHTEQAFTSEVDQIIQPVVADGTNLGHFGADGKDKSGYIDSKYGDFNKTLGKGLADLLELTTGTFTESNGEIYSTNLSYESYMDSFCVNFLSGTTKNNTTNPLVYTDLEGVQQSITNWSEITCDMKQARETGIPLTLAGISFSKMAASVASKDANSKVIRSLMHYADVDGREYNCPKAYGFLLSGSNMYFRGALAWGMGESGGSKTYANACMWDNSGTSWGSLSKEDGGKKWETWRPYFLTDGNVQGMVKGKLGFPIVAFVVGCYSDRTSHGGYGKINNVGSDLSWKNLKSTFGTPGSTSDKPYDSPGVCPKASVLNNSSKYVIHSFAVYDQEQNIVVPFADYFISRGGQQVAYNNGTSPGKVITPTLANMLCSLLSQLYVVDSEAEGKLAVLSNFVSLQNYIESWNKDIIVEVNVEDLTQETTDDLITIQKQKASDYYKYLKANAQLDDAEKPDYDEISSNIEIYLYGTQRVIRFQFDVAYNTGNLPYIFSQMGTSQNVIEIASLEKSTDAPKSETFSGNVSANTLYTWTGSNVIPFGQGSTIKYAESFTAKDKRFFAVLGTNPKSMKSGSFATLAKVMRYEDGELIWRNLSQFATYNSTYDFRYDGTGDDPWLRGLPLINIFNEYKPK